MRPSARHVTTLPGAAARFLDRGVLCAAMLLLGGCSGLGHFLSDTVSPPGRNPNQVLGTSENLQRARGRQPVTEAIRPQDGNVWPGPPQPLPTLSDVAHGGVAADGTMLAPGGSMSIGERNSVRNGSPIAAGFSGGGLENTIPDPAERLTTEQKTGGASGRPDGEPGGSANIVIPNGDGTSTVITPDGGVKTVKGMPD